ncbi:MAG: GGDEF domain-containing protein [Candidatus Omnitrophota bacterium]
MRKIISRISESMIFSVNIMLMLLSWIFYKYPHGDEYLVLFMISLIFMIAPYIMNLRLTFVLLVMNLLFLLMYRFLGALNMVDVAVLMSLFISGAGASYMVKTLYASFLLFQKTNILSEGRRYNGIVNELDVVDRRGRKIENELNRMSRLYEITKQLAPVLKSEDLFDALFAFLRENFVFNAAHLIMFKKGKFSKGVSKNVGAEDYYADAGTVMDYNMVVEFCAEKDFKPVFLNRTDDFRTFDRLNIRADTCMIFPLFVGERISSILAIEGGSRSSFGRFRLLIPQITLEFRKVELYEKVQELSIIDGLTEVYLRRYLMYRLEEEVDRARRLGLTFSIGMVDVDHFKQCNDKYGHLVGDAVLKKISEKLRNSVREVDMIARYGGEEFCVVLPETTKELAVTVAERLRRSVEEDEIKAFDEKVRITVSIGIATFPHDGEDVSSLIDKADTALYRAKRTGRNVVCSA